MRNDLAGTGDPWEMITCASPSELAGKAARDWWTRVKEVAETGGCLKVTLSGGRITKPFFAAFVEMVKRDGSTRALEALRFFWADERCVAPTDPESNYRLADESLFAPLGIAKEQIFRIQGELEPEEGAAQADKALREADPPQEGALPELDLIFLGMGEDGHVASLFPGGPESVTSAAKAYEAVTASKPPPYRITLTYPAIQAARDVWVLASGQGKEDALRRSLKSDGDTPLARVLRSRHSSRLLTDIHFTAIGSTA